MKATSLAFLLLAAPACKEKASTAPAGSNASAAAPSLATGSAAAPASATPPAGTRPAVPACGMASNPGMATDLGKATLRVDGEELCGNYWHAHGYALGQRLDRNMLHYTSEEPPSLTGPASSMPSPNSKQRYALLEPTTPIAISLNLAHKFNDREYVSVQLDLAGFPLSAWNGKSLTAEVEADGKGFVMAQDQRKRAAFAMVEIVRGSDPKETLYGKSGTLTIESYDLTKQAFQGTFNVKVGPIAGLGTGKNRTLEGTFAIRAFD